MTSGERGWQFLSKDAAPDGGGGRAHQVSTASRSSVQPASERVPSSLTCTAPVTSSTCASRPRPVVGACSEGVFAEKPWLPT